MPDNLAENSTSKKKDIWADDYLDRKSDARFLIDFLSARATSKKDAGHPASFVLNLDARWGEGKTHFLTRLQQQLHDEQYLAVYVNAWSIDHMDDPLIPILSGLQNALKPFLSSEKPTGKLIKNLKSNAGKILFNVTKGVIQTAATRYVGSSIAELVSGIDEAQGDKVEVIGMSAIEGASKELSSLTDKMTDELIENFEREKEAIVSFRENLSAVVESVSKSGSKKAPVFLLIDELDRCKPSFAVALLERVKHLFSTDNLVTIVATDTSQLKHSINGVYGGNFDGYSYLKRFFDRGYIFADPDASKFIDFCISRLDLTKARCPNQKFHDLFFTGFRHFKLTLRDFEQCIALIENFLDNWKYDIPVEMVLLFPASVKFHFSGSINLDELKETCIGWTLEETWRNYNRNTNNRSENRYNIASLIQSQLPFVRNLDGAANMQAKGDEQRYTYDTFVPEWNNKSIDLTLRPSIQNEIPAIISSVSRLSK